jgi:uncharacterized protein YjiS (DUF1127 family)
MEMIMGSTLGTLGTLGTLARAADRTPSLGSGLIATVRAWWMGYLSRRIERAAIMQLHAMSDQELQDIGLTRCQIAWAVRGEFGHRPFTHQY